MLLLGIDTSGKTASAALLETNNMTFLAQTTLYTQKTHSQVIMPLCKTIIEQSGKKISDLDAVAVANGPGSYTGLRIGVAAVKALCFGLDIKCCGVSTLEGLAWNNIAFQGVICSIMKARGALVYTCTYENNSENFRPLCRESIMETSVLSEYMNSISEPILLCGDAAEEFFWKYCSGNIFEEKFRRAPAMGMLQNASGICLAAVSKKMIMPELLEVSYLQKVKAEKDLEEKNK